MNCYIHGQKSAVGTCVGCGKFICEECQTEIDGKNYCKNCVGELLKNKGKEIEKLENKVAQPQAAPMVFMNAGGGASSSSSASAAAGGGRRNAPPYPRNSVGIHILLVCFTGGIGNIIYYFYVKSKQNQWTMTYGG